jgi:fructose-1-phosphate kinase PfkB-like protein
VAFEKDQHEAGIKNGPPTEDEIDYDQLRFTMYKYSVPSLVGHGTTTTSSSTTTNTNSTDEEEKEHKKLVLYPIGAGDAVAGGTIAAWTSLTTAAAAAATTSTATAASSTSSSSILSDACFNLVQDFCHKQQINPTRTHHTATTILQQQQQDALASFAFGLACGSASCLQPENSVLEERDVLRLFPQIVIDKY